MRRTPAWLPVLLLLSGCGDRATDGNGAPEAGRIGTYAGTGKAGFSGDGGAAGRAQLHTPVGVAPGPGGGLVVVDFGNHRIRAIAPDTEAITTLEGDGSGSLLFPTDIAFAGGDFYVTSWGSHQVFRYRGGKRAAAAGTGQQGCSESGGNAGDAAISRPRAVGLLADGTLLIAEQGCRRLLALSPSGELSPWAGTGAAGYGGDDGPAAEATFGATDPRDGLVPGFGFALSPENPPDELYVADTGNHVIREINLFSGTIRTFAGTGEPGFADGPPRSATFNRPAAVFVSEDHTVWVADTGNHAIRRIDPLQIEVATVAGTGRAGYNGDGIPALEARLDHPAGVYVTGDGVIYIADSGNHRIRRVSLPGYGPLP